MRRPLGLIPAYSPLDSRLLDSLSKVGLPYLHVHECSDEARARSQLLSDALRTEADVFVLLSPDIAPSADQLVQLIESEHVNATNALSGRYYANSSLVEAFEPEPGSPTSPRIRCVSAGAAFAAIDRGAVERLQSTLPTLLDQRDRPWQPFFLPLLLEPKVDAPFQYFDPVKAFWWRLRTACSLTLWLDPDLMIGRAIRTVVLPDARDGRQEIEQRQLLN